MSEKNTSRTSQAQNVDLARHPLDQKKGQAVRAFKAAQEIRQEQAQQKDQDRSSGGSEMVKKDKTSPELKPKGPTRNAVDRAEHNRQLAAERAKAAQEHRQKQSQRDQDKGRG